MTADALPRRSLRSVMTIAIVPLACVVLVGGVIELVMANGVHRNILRLFEELREVALTRTLVEELRGVETWRQELPDATPSTHPLIFEDVRRHYDEAMATLARFEHDSDPSDRGHESVEDALRADVERNLRAIGEGLEQGLSLGQMGEQIDLVQNAADAIARAVDDESRAIGAGLDEKTDEMVQVLAMLGVASVLTFGVLVWLLLRRVLQPVEELRDTAVRFGRGELGERPAARRNDELGDLADAFRAMAAEIEGNQNELERRVDERSREVLRTARLAQLGTLAAGIAHEINNPLASIVACSEGLVRDVDRGGVDEKGLREYLGILNKEAMRARDITQKLLRFARQEPKRHHRFDMAAEAREVVALFQHQAESAGIALRVEAGEGLWVEGDPSEWRQVLFNLVRNALDASIGGGEIVLGGHRAGARVVFEVTDRGTGIPERVREQVFEPFVTTKDPGKGTGLGLAIVHRIVTGHGGTIRAVDNAPGTRFVIELAAAD